MPSRFVPDFVDGVRLVWRRVRAKGRPLWTAENDGHEQAEDAEHYIKGMYVYSTLYTKSL